MEKFKIYLDFDGTVVEHDYPNIGRCNFGCFEVIKKLQDAGHEIILNTYRIECDRESFEQAQKYLNETYWNFCKDKNTELQPILKHTGTKSNPVIWDWNIMKQTKEIWIDDIANDIPIKPCVMMTDNMVDWDELDKQFKENDLY